MSSPPTVLALRALGLGDALTGVPALRGLRRAHPDARLLLAAPEVLGSWLGSMGIVDAVVPAVGLEPLAWDEPGPDVAVNLHGRGPQSHDVLRQLRPGQLVAFGCPGEDGQDAHEGPPWPEQVHEVDRWCSLVATVGGCCDAEDLRLPRTAARGGHVVVHPGAASASRRWPRTRWRAVSAVLTGAGREVVVTGTREEADLCAEVASLGARDLSGRLDLHQLSQLVGSAALVLCGDTGVAHLATALGTPSVLLFGPSAPQRWGPLIDPDRHHVLWHEQPSDPAGDPHGDQLDVRLARVSAEEVVDAAHQLLSLPRARPA